MLHANNNLAVRPRVRYISKNIPLLDLVLAKERLFALINDPRDQPRSRSRVRSATTRKRPIEAFLLGSDEEIVGILALQGLFDVFCAGVGPGDCVTGGDGTAG